MDTDQPCLRYTRFFFKCTKIENYPFSKFKDFTKFSPQKREIDQNPQNYIVCTLLY